jgi:hypothetical protein
VALRRLQENFFRHNVPCRMQVLPGTIAAATAVSGRGNSAKKRTGGSTPGCGRAADRGKSYALLPVTRAAAQFPTAVRADSHTRMTNTMRACPHACVEGQYPLLPAPADCIWSPPERSASREEETQNKRTLPDSHLLVPVPHPPQVSGRRRIGRLFAVRVPTGCEPGRDGDGVVVTPSSTTPSSAAVPNRAFGF